MYLTSHHDVNAAIAHEQLGEAAGPAPPPARTSWLLAEQADRFGEEARTPAR